MQDAPYLAGVEQSAGELFRTIGMDFVADHAVSPINLHRRAIKDGLHWVATDQQGMVIGFCIGMAYGATLYIAELAVAGPHQRQGFGRDLMLYVIDAAARRGFNFIALRTFRAVAWNAPFYASLGFVEGGAPDIATRANGFAAHESVSGIDPASRCTMSLALS